MSPTRLDSINERTYRGILLRQDSEGGGHRMGAGLEESITAFSRHRYTSQLSKEENLLGSLAVTRGFIEGASLHSVPSQTSLNQKEEVCRSVRVCVCAGQSLSSPS